MENNSTITLRETLWPNPQRGRCICFRTVKTQRGVGVNWLDIVSFYSIPFDFFGDGGDDDVNSSNPDVEVLLPFCTSTGLSRWSRLSSVGSSLFVVEERKGFNTYAGFLSRFDTTAPTDGWSAIRMLAPRALPITVVMDGKLYVFGGAPAPLGELFDPRMIPSTSLPLHPPPCFPSNGWLRLAIVSLESSKKILVASADVAFVFNCVDQVWEELDHKVDFSSVRGKAAVFRNGTALCWCSRDAEEVHVYDLVLKRWFKSPIKGLDKICYREQDLPWNYCPLFPLDDNHLCLLWQDIIDYDDTILSLFHCAKIRVSISTGARGESRFDAVVVASRSYALLGRRELIADAHVFLGEKNEGGERGSGLVGHDHGSWELCGYGSGHRTTSSIAPFKICSKCSLPGHMERDCKGIPCFRSGVIGHMASDCCIVNGGGGGGGGDGVWNVSCSGSWVGQPVVQ